MRFLLPGGTGQVGTMLARSLVRDGHQVVVFARHPVTVPWPVLLWDPTQLGPWTEAMNETDVVINLAGRSVNCRYTPENQRDMMDSRVLSTKTIGEAIVAARTPPRLWLQASTATIYAHRFDAPNDEATGIIGGTEHGVPPSWHFSIKVATAWERALEAAVTPATRKVALRSAMIMSPDPNGIFDTLLTLVRRRLYPRHIPCQTESLWPPSAAHGGFGSDYQPPNGCS